jgi:hypothetical protein
MKMKHFIEYTRSNNKSDIFSNWEFTQSHIEMLDDFEIPIYFLDDWFQLFPSNIPTPE